MSDYCFKIRNFGKIFIAFVLITIAAMAVTSAVNAECVFPNNTYSLPAGKDMLLAPSSASCDRFNWSSDNSSVVFVDSRGIIHGASRGRAEITAVNKCNNETSKCYVEVGEPDPVRVAFTSSNMVGINAPFDIKTLTEQNVESIRFEVRGKNYSQDFYCNNRSNHEGLDLWTQGNVRLPHAGTYRINAYAKINGGWRNCSGSYTEIFVVDGFNRSEPSLAEKRVSPEGAEFIASCEGFRSSVYRDMAGLLTIGYGKRIHPYEPFYNNIGKLEGAALFFVTVNQGSFTKSVNKFLIGNSVKFNQQQFDALVSFSYNLGCRWMFNGSGLSKILLKSGESSTSWHGTVDSSNGLFVRSSPSFSAKKLGALCNRSRVDVLNPEKQNDSWYHIRTSDGIIGYCCSDYLRVDSVSTGEKSLNFVNKNEFTDKFSLYHHLCKKCHKGLLARRFHELDIFFYGVYSKFRSEHFSYGDYPIPECVKKIM